MTNGCIYNLIGYAGDFIVLFAYYMLQTNRIKADQISYALYNFISSIFLLVSLYHTPNSPVIIIEVAWAIISLYGIYKFFLAKKYNSQLRSSKTN